MSEILTITKRLAARMEIDGAIRALADHQNFIATELLASAAIDVIAGVARDAKLTTMSGEFEQRIKPEKLREVKQIFRKPYNFLKHSDRDKGSAIDRYQTEAAIWRLFIAITDYEIVWKAKSVPMFVFLTWFLSRYPSVLRQGNASLTENYIQQHGNISEMSQSDALFTLRSTFQEYDMMASEIANAMSSRFPGNVEI